MWGRSNKDVGTVNTERSRNEERKKTMIAVTTFLPLWLPRPMVTK